MKNLKKITAIVTVVIGIIVIALGLSIMNPSANYSASSGYHSYFPETFDVSYASFGADFYTYMYRASDTIVEELNAINQAMGTVVKAQSAAASAAATNVSATNGLIKTVGKVGGTIVIAIGLSILANGIQSVGNAFAPALACAGNAEVAAVQKKEESLQEASQEQTTEV